jgi:hypothetical protein
MKRIAMMAAVALLAAGCGSSSPNSPSSPPNTIVFTAALSPANEVPPVTNADANARGTGTFTLNLTRDSSGAITEATGTFAFTVTGFPAGTIIRGMHIHEAGPGVNGSVIIDSQLTAANPAVLADGSGSQTISNRPLGSNPAAAPALAQRIIDNPNGFYFNMHTGVNLGGAIRAQLVRQ